MSQDRPQPSPIRRLTYVSWSVLPSREANSVHVMKMASAFAEQDIRVRLIARRASDRRTAHDEIFRQYGVQPRFRLMLLPALPIGGTKTPYALVSLLMSRLWRSDVIYTRLPRAAEIASILGMRAVLELHHPIPPNDARTRAVKRYLNASRAPLLVAITETLRQQLISDLGCAPDLVIVAPDGADPIDPNLSPALPPTESSRMRVGFLGHLYRGKGMELIERIAPQASWADFVIVGGNEEDIAYWKNRVAHLENVRLRGFVPHCEVPAILRSFDVALLPNQRFVAAGGSGALNISRWTSPLKAFEYMAAGLPIVASEQENLREIFRDGENALLCDPDDVSSWVSALKGLAEDARLRLRLGLQARRDFEDAYSWSARAKRLAAVFRTKFTGLSA